MSEYQAWMSTAEAEAYSGIKGLAKRRVQGTSPPYTKLGSGNSKVLYSRKAIDEYLNARTRRSTSEQSAEHATAGAA